MSDGGNCTCAQLPQPRQEHRGKPGRATSQEADGQSEMPPARPPFARFGEADIQHPRTCLARVMASVRAGGRGAPAHRRPMEVDADVAPSHAMCFCSVLISETLSKRVKRVYNNIHVRLRKLRSVFFFN